MIRAVLAVAATTVLLAASLPAVDDARRQHTEGVVREDVETLERTARALVETEDVTGEPGARRVITLALPERSWTHAGLDELVIAGRSSGIDGRNATGRRNATEGPTATGGRVVVAVSGGRRTTHLIESVALRTPGDEPVRLRGTGRRRLVLSLGGTPRRPVVTVQQFDPGDGPRSGHRTLAREDATIEAG